VSEGRGCSGGTVPSAASIQLSRSACVNPGHAGTSGSWRREIELRDWRSILRYATGWRVLSHYLGNT
jgi:hypothetical protein